MKRGLKIGLGIAGVVVGLPLLALACGAVYVYGVKPTKRAPQALTAPTGPEAVERGRYLAENVYQCNWCHSPFDRDVAGLPPVKGQELAGRDWKEDMDVPAELKDSFHVYAPNISSDKTAGVGGWTDGEIVRAVREGIRKDGSPLFEFMPYKVFRDKMSDQDALAIVAYIRASQPQSKPSLPTKLPLPADIGGRRLAPQPVTTAFAGTFAGEKERGEWLLSAAMCHLCHDTRGDEGSVTKALGGGDTFKLPSGPVTVPNISSDPAKGIGSYSVEDLVKVLSEGTGKSGKPLRGMPWSRFRGLTAEDKHAIAVALKASPPVQ